jgi:hypothetical protein
MPTLSLRSVRKRTRFISDETQDSNWSPYRKVGAFFMHDYRAEKVSLQLSQDVFVLQTFHVFRTKRSWQGNQLARSRCIPPALALSFLLSRHAPSGRCIASQRSLQATPDTPMMISSRPEGEFSLPAGYPSPIPLRPTVRRLDMRQGSFQRPLWNTLDKGHVIAPLEPLTVVPARLRAKGKKLSLVQSHLAFQ